MRTDVVPGVSTRLDDILGRTVLDPALWHDPLACALVERLATLARRVHGLRPQEAEQAAQDTLAELWQARDRFSGEVPVRSYVGGILRHLARAARCARLPPVADAVPDPPDRGPRPEEIGVAAELESAVRSCASQANPGDAAAYRLLARSGATPASVARELGIAPNALYQRLSRFRESVRRCLEAKGYLEPE